MPVRPFLSIALASVALTACQQGGDAGGNQTASANQNATTTPGPATASGAPVTVGGAPMYPNKTIIENASTSSEHTTLVNAVKAAGLDRTLAGAGPYTVFAPTNAAFGKLPAGTVEGLMQPQGKGALTGILSYHVVPGLVLAEDLRRSIQKRGGRAELATVGGGKLTVTDAGGAITVTDSKGGQARVTQGNVMQSNGVVHVVDAVLMPS
nr:fasciclin domain-containing protein [uncultured Sphingosinicella sp.]